MRMSRHVARNERGAALILVLWVSAAAAALAMGFLGWARAEVGLNRNAEAEIRARLATRSALAATAFEMASGRLALKKGEADLTVSVDGIAVQVTVHGESGLIDLNKGSQGLLEGLAIATGVDRREAAAAAKAIVAWRDVGKSKSQGQGQLIQRKLFGDRLVSRTDHSFDHVNELRLVPDLDPGVLRRMVPWLTVYSRDGQVDSDLAPAMIRKALTASPAGPTTPGNGPTSTDLLAPGASTGPLSSTQPPATAATQPTAGTGTSVGAVGTMTGAPGAATVSATPSPATGAPGIGGATATPGSLPLGGTASTGIGATSATTDPLATDAAAKQAEVAGTSDPKKLYRVTLVARAPAGLVTRHTVVIWLDGGADHPYRVLDWSPPELAGEEVG
jgi:general secretion pathway protein K